MKYIHTFIKYVLVIGLFTVVHIASAANFSVSEKLDSYNSVTKQMTLTVNIQAEKTEIQQLEMFFAKSPQLLESSPIRGFTYNQKPLAIGKADTRQVVISDVEPGDVYFYYIDNNSEKTSVRKLSLTSTFTTPGTATQIANNPSIYFDFPNTTDHIKYGDTWAEFNGTITKIADNPAPVKFSVYLGTSTNNFFDHQSFDLTQILATAPSSPWVAGFVGLKPETTYYVLVKNDTDNNPNTYQIGSIYSFTTTKSGTGSSSPQYLIGEDSPAATDNDGQGGAFSYKYPTNITDTGGGNNINAFEGPIVPCTSNSFDERCRYQDLMILVKNIIKFLLMFIIPVVAIVAVYTGMQMILNRSNPVELSKYKANALRIVIGIIIILLAWTLVASIFAAVVNEDVRKILLLDLTGL
jgi:hypothetical protein